MKKLLLAICTIISTLCINASEPVAGHVVLIGLDGWGAYSMPQADMPAVKKLMDEGCYTLTKRTVSPSSSAPNWASMFMGVGPELHGYTTWGARTPELPSRVITKNNIFPTIFQIYRDQYPEARQGIIYEWEGIKYLVDTLSLNDHIHTPYDGNNSEATCTAAIEYIKSEKPNLVGIFFDNPDHIGHTAGHDTPEYYEVLKELDGYIARIVKAVDDAGLTDDTIFIISSDHGGIEKGHGGITMAEMETPFIISGKNVRKEGAFEQSMMQFDVASTIAHILGVEQPQVWIGRPMLQVFK